MSVYLIRSAETRAVKIGWSENPTRRLADLQTHNEHHLDLVVTISTERQAEFRLHKVFKEERLHHEWFRGERVDQFIETVTACGRDGLVVLDVLEMLRLLRKVPSDRLESVVAGDGLLQLVARHVGTQEFDALRKRGA